MLGGYGYPAGGYGTAPYLPPSEQFESFEGNQMNYGNHPYTQTSQPMSQASMYSQGGMSGLSQGTLTDASQPMTVSLSQVRKIILLLLFTTPNNFLS